MVRPSLSCYKLLLLTLLAACSSAKNHYLLRPSFHEHESVANPSAEQRTYALRDLKLAPYLDDTRLLYLQSANQVVVEKNHLWSEDLRRNIRQVLAQDLTALSAHPVHVFPLAANLRPERVLDVQIIEMIANRAERQFIVSATWQVSAADERHPPTHRFARRYPMARIAAAEIAAAYQRALGDLAKAIAATLPPP